MTVVPITSPDLKATEVSFFQRYALMIIAILEFQMDVYVQVGHIARKLLNALRLMAFEIFSVHHLIRSVRIPSHLLLDVPQ